MLLPRPLRRPRVRHLRRSARAPLLALACALACASGGRGGADPTDGFAAFDRNGDGAIDRREYLEASADSFARIDADRDGLLTGPELERFPPEVRLRLDGNADGIVTRDEFLGSALGSFFRCDPDRDDRVTRAEADTCGQAAAGP